MAMTSLRGPGWTEESSRFRSLDRSGYIICVMLETKCLSRIRIVILVLVLFISIGCHTSAEKSEAKIPGGMYLESLSVDPRCAIVIGRVCIDDDGKKYNSKNRALLETNRWRC